MKDYAVYCPYCHKHTSLYIPPATDSSGDVAVYTQCHIRIGDHDRWAMGVCNACSSVVLIHESDMGSYWAEEYYPTPLPSPVDTRLPDFIKADLQEAKLCFSQSAFNATAMLCRRAIALICMDKKANPKSDLFTQIGWMRDNHIITGDMSTWAHTVRLVGNDVAHPEGLDNTRVEEEDAQAILELAEQMANTLYVTPAIAEAQKQKRDNKVLGKK